MIIQARSKGEDLQEEEDEVMAGEEAGAEEGTEIEEQETHNVTIQP